MGVLDQIIAGLGGAAQGASQEMSVTDQLRQKRAALQRQAQQDAYERVDRNQQVSRQQALDEHRAEQDRLANERAQQAQDRYNRDQTRRDEQLELDRKDNDRKERATTAQIARLSTLTAKNVAAKGTTLDTETGVPASAAPLYSGVKARMDRNNKLAGEMRQQAMDATGKDAEGLTQQSRGYATTAAAQSDSLSRMESAGQSGFLSQTPQAQYAGEMSRLTQHYMEGRAKIDPGNADALKRLDQNYMILARQIKQKHTGSP